MGATQARICLKEGHRVEPRASEDSCPLCGGTLVPEAGALKALKEETDPPALPQEVVQHAQDPSRRFDKYVLCNLLGRGGMGEVYRAYDPSLGRYVALKLVQGVSEQERQRFVREACMAAALQHPSIAQVYEQGECNGRLYIAMQLIDGVPLDRAELNLREKLQAVEKAARAVAYAHERGVVHRDIKPGNIMVDTTGAVYLMDFGLAKPLAASSGHLSFTGQILGTPSFMSPEQARGEAVDARADVYGLGATLYTVVCGRPPFIANPHEDFTHLLGRVISEEPVAPRRANPAIPWEVETIVLKAMFKERERRYHSATELADDIRRYLDGEPIRAKRASIAYRLRKSIAKRKAVFAVVAAGLGALILFAAAVVPGWMAARREAQQLALYLPLEGELNLLRIKMYQPKFRLTPEELQKYESLVRKIQDRMNEWGESAHGWCLIGRCREVTGDFAGAERAYRSALGLEPGHRPTLLNFGRLRIQRALVKHEWARSDSNRYRVAVDEAKEGASLIRRGLAGGNGAGMELDLAQAYLRLIETGERWSAETMLAKWKGKDFVEEFLLVEAISRKGLERVEAATKVIALAPSWERGYYFRATGRQGQGDLQGAIDDYTTAIEIHPRLAELYYHRGTARYMARQFDAAAADLTRAIEIQPDLAEAYVYRGLARLDQNDAQTAGADFSRALEIEPRYFDAFIYRGHARRAVGDWELALADYDRAIGIRSDDGDVFTARADARVALAARQPSREREHLNAAVADYETALKLIPQSSPARARIEKALKDVASRLAR